MVVVENTNDGGTTFILHHFGMNESLQSISHGTKDAAQILFEKRNAPTESRNNGQRME